MVDLLRFIAPSGSPASGFIIQPLAAGNISGAQFIGFFGAGGPQGIPNAVLINSYQNTTYITNASGENLGFVPYGVRGSGQLTNIKFITVNTAQVNSNPTVTLLNVPELSGTVLMRFTTASPVQTQNALVRAVNLTATSGVSSETAIVANIDVRGAEIGGRDTTWTNIAGNSAVDNRIFLDDHTTSNITHDYHIALSASPQAVGRRNDWAFFGYVEFL